MSIFAYIRVSTTEQETHSQREQLERYERAEGIYVDEWCYDKISGVTRWQDRELQRIINESKPADTLIVSEISRIARSTVGVLTFLEAAAEKQLRVIVMQSKMTIDSSINSKIFVTVLALAAEIERDLLRTRTQAALAARKAKGLPLGRQRGSRVASKLEARREEINLLIDAKVSIRAIARVMECSSATVTNFLERPPIDSVNKYNLPLPGLEPLPPKVTRSNRKKTTAPEIPATATAE